ncbi:hypothetical protein AY601_0443 [Pedobacter cryoconitis]|uniref:Phytanoyl-CoA dioxygenase n=1 Tax=Pedobacter cryoconitis TaxID=188932 RepID=A0A127V866_9SPHI|nr:phytanoyl-CoA dioxygenase family protein [Pedobacter cryoconitis]AMP97399.1 hypothetical protein AY601_0443 [Pedobacter cryoconitis]
MKLSNEKVIEFEENGFLTIPKFYSDSIVDQIRIAATDLMNQPNLLNGCTKYYENSVINANEILCRIENFIGFNDFYYQLMNDPGLLSILEVLFKEAPVLFKEKINYKLPGGNPFAPHQDAPAYAMFDCDIYLTVMICIDDSAKENGTLAFAKGRHKEGIFPVGETGEILESYTREMEWDLISLRAGDIMIFDSFVPHKSDANLSEYSRGLIFSTYNKISFGDLRKDYYDLKRKHFPPDHERDPNKDYSLNNPFNLANPLK